jgi:A/G-specific adenine glycosylase
LRGRCRGLAAGRAEELPKKAPKAAPRAVEAVAVLLARGGRYLAVRRPPRGLLGGLWELPGGDLTRGERPSAGAARALRERVGLDPLRARRLGAVNHVFTHRALRLHVFRAEAPGGRVRRRDADAHRWLSLASLQALPLSVLAKKALALAADGG